jgi:hypothetical protein
MTQWLSDFIQINYQVFGDDAALFSDDERLKFMD